MRVLWVFAHPEAMSLNGSLRAAGESALTEAGHEVRTSDLYAMKWKAVLDADDFTDEPDGRLAVGAASERAHRTGTLAADVRAEQEKLDWADTLVVQFPLWWYGMPAILKGWFDRVFVKGYAYGVTDQRHPDRILRYGEGNLAGKRALVVVTAGSRPSAMSPRGINGPLEQVLFPLLHGTLWYAGMSVLPPVAVYAADHADDPTYRTAATLLRDRVTTIGTTTPIPYRYQNHGDYDDNLVLRPDLSPGREGLSVHSAE